MSTRLPIAIDLVVLVLVLPLAFAYLLSLFGVLGLCLHTALRRLDFLRRPDRSRP